MQIGSGDAKKVWHLPEKLLKSKSAFFTAALKSGFAEGISKTIRLPEDDPDIFKYFVKWLYVGYKPNFPPNFFVPLWALGDRLSCPLMQDDVMSGLVGYYVEPHLKDVTLKQIYELSAPRSKIRRFAVDKCLLDVKRNCPDRHGDGCPFSRFVKDNKDFARQLLETFILLGNDDPNVPSRDKSPYLCAPSPAKSKTRSGS